VARRLNVLHVISNLNSGGVQHLLVKSLAVLDRIHFSHQVCCVSAGGVYEEELRSLGVPCTILRRRARFDPTIVSQMASLMRRERIDVAHTLNFTANAWGRLAARLAGVPRVIAHERGTAWTEDVAMRWVDRMLYRWTDLWLANSQAARIVLTEHVKIPGQKVCVVYNGMPEPTMPGSPDLWLRGQCGLSSQAPLTIAVGRLDTPKGYDFLLRAMSHVVLSLPQARLTLIGDGPLRGCLEDEAHRLGLLEAGIVRFLGFVPNAFEAMTQADLLVHPAIREPLGNVLIEAGHAGLPVVASSVDGCAEVVLDGMTGMLVECTEPVQYVRAPGASPLPRVVVDGHTRRLRPPLGPEPETLAACMVELLQHPDLRHELGERARVRMREVFSLDRYVRDLERAYRGD
jgi:glycosyltransferase involved in cell wall biosynthesis